MKTFSSAQRTAAAAILAITLVATCAASSGRHAAAATLQRPPDGYLGIGFRDVPDDEATALHWKVPHGAEIDIVDHDGPAGKAGLRPRDIITALNGQIIDSAATLKRLIHEAGANVVVALDVMRGAQKVTLKAKLVSRDEIARTASEHLAAPPPPPPDSPDGIVVQSFTVETYAATPGPVPEAAAKTKSPGFISSMLHSGPFTGMEAEELGPQMRAFFGVADGMGLLVTRIAPGSPAYASGLHAGDVVVRADGIPMKSVGDWTKHIKSVKGHAILVAVVRDRHEQTLTLSLGLKKHSAVVCTPLSCIDTTIWS